MKADSKLRVGIVGLGKMGIMHACLLSTFPNVDVAALCDRSRLIRTIAKQPFKKAVVTEDLEKFVGLDLDAVFVLTPIPSHYPIIKLIYDREIAENVFVEKTLTGRFSQSQELQALCEQRGGVNMVGYMKRFGVTFNLAKELLAQNVLGALSSFSAYAFSSDFADVDEGSTLSVARGGVLEDLGSHVVDLSVWLFGDLKPISAVFNSRISPNSEDDVSFTVKGVDGLSGVFDVSWRRPDFRMPEFGVTVHGDNGSLSVNDDEVKLVLDDSQLKRWYRADMDDNVGFLLGGPEYYREDSHFLDSVTSGVAAKSDFKEALRVDFLIDKVRQLCKD
ncbi:MAG TPA: Gfo/Idh/MocA family oxidoreductase [Candidatus Acidoferrales bacterium]|nr:Gfo/Idh/MocA family oxidoreductase [Candidatus Acidoferrales bacterium]